MNATASKIYAALAPMEQALRQAYAERLIREYEQIILDIMNDGWDRNKRYDYPGSSLSRNRYLEQVRRYELAKAYTEPKPDVIQRGGWNSPLIVQVKPGVPAKLHAKAAEMAKAALIGYAEKLGAKIDASGIEEVVYVKYVGGTNVWGWSHVVVNWNEQFWRTKMIVNVSCLGKPFNQWPTRQVAGIA